MEEGLTLANAGLALVAGFAAAVTGGAIDGVLGGAAVGGEFAAPSRDSLCWPYSVAACGRTLVVADSGNNRVLLWEAAS